MTLGTGFDLFTHWIRNQGLEIVLYVVGAMLVHRAVAKIARMWTTRLDAQYPAGGDAIRSEESKYRHSLVQVVAYVVIALVYVLATVKVVERALDIPITALVAPATVLGAALGFGAQRIVQDFLAGFFIITERQYGYGDLVQIDANGSLASGTVEDVTLRVTRVRTLDGEVVTIPNGQIVMATNQSRDWARSVIDVPVPNTADMGHVADVLHEICAEVMEDERVGGYILDEPTVMGIETIALEQTTMRLLVRTLPGKQWEVGRRIRALITRRFRAEGIKLEPEALAAIRAGMMRPTAQGGANA